MKKSHNFRELKIWQDSMSLVKVVYEITSKLPIEERFGFVSQSNRCSVSIPSNIAEGSGRSSEKEFVRFLVGDPWFVVVECLVSALELEIQI